MRCTSLLFLLGFCLYAQSMQVQTPAALAQSENARKLNESLRQAGEALKNVKNNVKQRFVRLRRKAPQELDIVRSWLKEIKLDDKTRAEVEVAVKNGVDKLLKKINNEFALELGQIEPQLEQWFSADANSPESLLKNLATLLQNFVAPAGPVAATAPGKGNMPTPMPAPQKSGSR